MPAKPRIEHVFYNPENPSHREHLLQLRLFRELDGSERNILHEWKNIEAARVPPFQEYRKRRLEEIRQHLENRPENLPELGYDKIPRTKFVIQYIDGKPSGFICYRPPTSELKFSFIADIFTKVELRDTAVTKIPVRGVKGEFLYYDEEKRKRNPPLYLAREMLHFVGDTENSNIVPSDSISEAGSAHIKKYVQAYNARKTAQ